MPEHGLLLSEPLRDTSSDGTAPLKPKDGLNGPRVIRPPVVCSGFFVRGISLCRFLLLVFSCPWLSYGKYLIAGPMFVADNANRGRGQIPTQIG
jgi:hypothetical protein